MARWVRWNNPTIKPPFGAQIDWSNPITEELVGCWLFNDYYSFSVSDLSLSQNSGSFSSGVTWKVDRIYINGNSKGIDIPFTNSLMFSGNDPITIFQIIDGRTASGWSFSQHNEIVLRKSSSDKVEFILNSFSSNDRVVSINTIPLEDKISIAGVYDSVILSVFLKGKKENSVIPSGSYGGNTYNFRIGGSTYGTQFAWLGSIYITYLWKRGLTCNEIQNLSNEPYSFFLYPQYWYLVDFGGINSKEYSSLYNILNKNEYNNKYNIQTKTEKNIKYDLLAQNSYVSKYNILTKKETDIGYDILTKTDYNITYDILNSLTKEIFYDILSAKKYNSKYDLLNSLTSSILYNILTKNEYNIIYDILGTTAIEYTIKYDILNSAQTNIIFDILSKKEANIKYDILTSRTSNIVYNILVKNLTNIIYDILAKKETTFLYDIINKKEINFKYDILATKLYTNIYNILAKSEYKILYDILSDIIIKPEIVFKLDKQDTIFKVGKINTIFTLK